MEKRILFSLTSREDDFLTALVAQGSCNFMSCRSCPIADVFDCKHNDTRRVEVSLAEFLLEHAKNRKKRAK